jgi:hypothetical protein
MMTFKQYFTQEIGVAMSQNNPNQSGQQTQQLEITSEQAIALSLSFIGQCLKSIAESMPKK